MNNLSLRLVTLIAGASATTLACGGGSEVPSPGGTSGGAGMSSSAGSGSSSGGTAAGAVSGGTSAGSGAGGASAGGASGASAGGGGAHAGGAHAGGTGAGGGAGGSVGGSAGGAGAGAGGTPSTPYGIVSCQPAFEVACKPPIEFVNGDPDGRGKVFTSAIPDVQTTMKDIACTVCSMLYRQPSEMPQNKRPSKIRLVLDDHGGVAQAGGDQIQFDLDYINGWANRSADQIKQEMLGVLQHETVHLYQNYGNGGTGEGLADLVRTRGGYYPRSRWQPGGTWRDAYTTSGFFYSWLTGPCAFHPEHYSMHDFDLPYKLNKALSGKSGEAAYTAVDQLLQQTFGKNAETLWDEYQESAF